MTRTGRRGPGLAARRAVRSARTAQLWSDSGTGGPGALLASFDNHPTLPQNPSPALITFTSAAGIGLSGSTSYWLALTIQEVGPLAWETTLGTSQSPVGWTIASSRPWTRGAGNPWEEFPFEGGVAKFSIEGTQSVPLPPTLALFGLGLAGLRTLRRRKAAA